MTQANVPELAYAPPVPWHRRKWPHRTMVAAGFGVLILAVWYYWGQDAWRQAFYLYWQHRAMTHKLPPEHVVYESDPLEAAKLIASGEGHYDLVSYHEKEGWRTSGQKAAAYYARIWPHLDQRERVSLFLHARKTPRGDDRLVSVWAGLWQVDDTSQALRLGGIGAAPATSRLRSRMTVNTVQGKAPSPFDYLIRHSKQDHLRIFAGQPDPKDVSRFHFAYELNGQRGTIAGWIAEDESVRLAVTSGPVVLEQLPLPW